MGKGYSPAVLKLNSEELKDRVLRQRKKYELRLPSVINKLYEVDELVANGSRSYRMIPKEGFDGTFIMYLYGGAMCRPICNEQWDFIVNVARKTNAAVFVPIYPIAPEAGCRETFEMLVGAYSNLSRSYDVERLILMGDSSGAGLALSLAELCWKEGMRKPDQLILLSPAVDTEFFDAELEKQVKDRGRDDKNYFFNDAAKDFINKYWVKDYAVKTEYTSPYYEDYTDICDDVVIFSGIEDMLNCYARALYNKAKQQGVNVRFFEFRGEKHNFFMHSGSAMRDRAFAYLIDVINKTFNSSLAELYPIKLMTEWGKQFPELFKTDWDTKFLIDNKFNFEGVKKHISQYRNLLMAASYSACDSKVKRFVMEYPNGTVVNIGCKLDNMFARVDNGRIQWYSIGTHNIMSVRRAMFGDREREKTIGRSIMDFSWMDEIVCERNHGVMFVCKDSLAYLLPWQRNQLIDALRDKFPGAELVFTAETNGARKYLNFRFYGSFVCIDKHRSSVDDAEKLLSSMGPEYKLKAEEPVTKYLSKQKKLKLKTRIGLWYNRLTYNYKIIHIRLGAEAYEVKL